MNDYIPYSRQNIDQEDIDAVLDVLKSDWLTTGPKIEEFEETIAQYVGAKYAVAVSSGTAALHCAMYAAEISDGDEVIVSPMTFAATSNAILYMGAKPIFSDVLYGNLLLDPSLIEEKITLKTKAIIAIDYAGQPCDYNALKVIADKHGLILIADACHSLGAKYKEKKVGSLADLNIFSFHPVKPITTGEGGMITTDNQKFACKMKQFRNHGISSDHRQRTEKGSWFYEMIDLGFNYRITDFQCALGISQLKKNDEYITRRNEIAKKYNEELSNLNEILILEQNCDLFNAYHLYVIRILNQKRNQIFKDLRESGVGANVHYIPVHLHPFYQNKLNTRLGMCPVAEKAYEEILSLPIYSLMKNSDVDRVINKLR